jgi:hypothetical protein
MKTIKVLFFFSLFSIHFSFAQSWMWAAAGHGSLKSTDDYGTSVVTDKSGNAYVTGDYTTLMDFDTISFTSRNSQTYLVKYSSNGDLIWGTESTGAGGSWATSEAIDQYANIYITGSGGVGDAFGSHNMPSDAWIFITKYDSSGNDLWLIGGINNSSYNTSSNAITTDRFGNIYISGGFGDSLIFGTYKLHSQSQDVFLVKCTSSGIVIWAEQAITAKNSSFAIGYGLSTDKFGNIYVTGTFVDSIKFGAFKLSTPGNSYQTGFLVKYDSSGSVIWATQSIGSVNAFGVLADESGNIYWTGTFTGSAIFGSDTLYSTSNAIFFVKCDSTGNVIWAKQSTGYGSWLGYKMSMDNSNHIYLAGSGIGNSLIFDNDTMVINGNWTNPAYLMKFDTSGRLICNSVMKNGGEEQANYTPIGEASYFNGNLNYIYLAGNFFNDTLYAGPDTLISTSGSSVYVARWQNCGGNEESTIPIKSPTSSITLFPNPTTGSFTITLVGAQNSSPSTLEIYNVLGEKVYSHPPTGGSPLTIELNQPSGLYLYRVLQEDGSVLGSGKIVVQK